MKLLLCLFAALFAFSLTPARADPYTLPYWYNIDYQGTLGPVFHGHYDSTKPDEYYSLGSDADNSTIPINLEYVTNTDIPSAVTFPFTVQSGDWALWWDAFGLCTRSVADGSCVGPPVSSLTVDVHDAGTGRLLQTLVSSPNGDAGIAGAHYTQPIYLVITAKGYWTAFIEEYHPRVD